MKTPAPHSSEGHSTKATNFAIFIAFQYSQLNFCLLLILLRSGVRLLPLLSHHEFATQNEGRSLFECCSQTKCNIFQVINQQRVALADQKECLPHPWSLHFYNARGSNLFPMRVLKKSTEDGRSESMFSFWRNLHTDFHSGGITSLHSLQ